MVALPQHKMTVDEYLAWAEGRPGRYELFAGTVYAMAPERVEHAEVKLAAQKALASAIKRAGLPCRVLPDGMTVRVTRETAHEPGALVYCGERLPRGTVEVPNPVIIVEVFSPSTRRIDSGAKLAGYFGIPSVAHYLMIDASQQLIIHYSRGASDTIVTRILKDGSLHLDPPGIDLQIAEIFADP